MLNVPNSIKALYQTDGVRKNFRVHFPNGEFADITNDNVVQESVKFTESLCSQSTFKFGLAEASVLEFETVGVGNMFGMTIEASMEIDTSSLSAADITAIQADEGDGSLVLASASDIGYGFYRIPLGTFRVDSCPRNHGAMAHRQVTAYTSMRYDTNRLIFSPALCIASSMRVSVNGLIALASGVGTTEITAASVSNTTPQQKYMVYSSDTYPSLTNMEVTLKKGAHGSGTSVMASALLSNGSNNLSDLGMIEGYNSTANYQIGLAAVEAFDSLNIDAKFFASTSQTSTSQGRAYADTGSMLRDLMPWLFYPCTGIRLKTGSYYVADCFAKVNTGEYFPIITEYTSSGDYVAFDIKDRYDSATSGVSASGTYLYALNGIAETDNLYLEVNIGSNTYYADLTLDNPQAISLSSVRRFTVNARAPYLIIENTAELNQFRQFVPSPRKHFPVYSFSNSFDMAKFLEGALEMYAAFVQRGRSGYGDLIYLDNSAPLTIMPENYDDMWWDEYDIDTIGTVSVTYVAIDENGTEQENTVTIGIGNGNSIYDMSDNDVYKSLSVTGLDDVAALIDTYFTPHIGAVNFTPTELTMQGWPWIEAGDALEAEAEDGTIVDTYALRVEMTGIQHLMMHITSEGGQIIENVEEVT